MAETRVVVRPVQHGPARVYSQLTFDDNDVAPMNGNERRDADVVRDEHADAFCAVGDGDGEQLVPSAGALFHTRDVRNGALDDDFVTASPLGDVGDCRGIVRAIQRRRGACVQSGPQRRYGQAAPR